MNTCWQCGVSTRDTPCDADGSGETGMIWPPVCGACHLAMKMKLVRIEAFSARFPGVEVTLEPKFEHHRVNQAYCRIGLRRGWSWKKFADDYDKGGN